MPFLTVADQILWEQRIHKESINAKARNDFSLRSAVSYMGVPGQFKPGHVDHSKDKQPLTFDPATLGWDLNGPTAKEFRRCINRQTAGPRERHQFPETSQQEHGWSQGIGSGTVVGRSEPSGSNPTKLGIGWNQKDGHGGVLAMARCKTPDVTELMEQQLRAPPRRSKEGNVRAEVGAPPFGTSFPVAKFKGGEASSSKAPSVAVGSSARRGGLTKTESAPTLATSKATRPIGAQRDEQFLSQEACLNTAMKESRRYLNRHDDNQWYHPLSNSDVAAFADNFTKCWGKQLYGKTK
mmetsp:Transcript_66933/g.139757  ORF Transcript_66933/g.139757 Transcript_66933/m.139757 type:complete len:295 (-) Transcript_66933:225-1109(-)